MRDQQIETAREDTMVYRKPTEDSDENAVQDIWGRQLEVRVVDASEVSELLAEGWVSHPMDLGGGKKPGAEADGGFVKVKGAALEAAEKLAEELTKERDALKGKVDDLLVKLAEAEQVNTALGANLKAAEDLANEESKAKEAALAEVATLKAPPAKLGVKKEGQS